MKPYGGFKNKKACPIHGDKCAVLHKRGKSFDKAAKKAERQRKKLLIEESINDAEPIGVKDVCTEDR